MAHTYVHVCQNGCLHTSFLAVPGVPQRIGAAEISSPVGTACIILVTWSPPANSDASDVVQYIVHVPSRNIILSSTLTTITIPNCGDDIRIHVAAVNRDGCVGMNSSEVLPILLDIPTAPATTEGGSATTTEGGSASTSGKHLKLVNLFQLCLAFTAFNSIIITIINVYLFLYVRILHIYTWEKLNAVYC